MPARFNTIIHYKLQDNLFSCGLPVAYVLSKRRLPVPLCRNPTRHSRIRSIMPNNPLRPCVIHMSLRSLDQHRIIRTCFNRFHLFQKRNTLRIGSSSLPRHHSWTLSIFWLDQILPRDKPSQHLLQLRDKALWIGPELVLRLDHLSVYHRVVDSSILLGFSGFDLHVDLLVLGGAGVLLTAFGSETGAVV